MIHKNQEYKYRTNSTRGVLGGMLVGAVAGAVTMLLLAPQSGKDTRKQLQEKGVELRDRTADIVEDTMAKVRTTTNKITMDLKDRGQEAAVEQLENVAEAAQAGKKVIQSP